MKKVNIVLFIFLIVVVLSSTIYFGFFYGNDNHDYTLYKKAYNELTSQEEFDEIEDLSIKITKTKSKDGESYLLSFDISNPRFPMQDIYLLAIDEDAKDESSLLCIGLVDKVNYTLVPDNTSNDNQRTGLVAGISSTNDVKNVLVYFSYIVNDQRIEPKFYEVEVTCLD